MAVFRDSPRCHKCGEFYETINKNKNVTFDAAIFGDNFLSWDIENHKCKPFKKSKFDKNKAIKTVDISMKIEK